MYQGDTTALDRVLALLDRAPQGADLSAVGAGPLEGLVHEHGNPLAEDIDRLARAHAGIRVAIQAVYVDPERLVKDAYERLVRLMPGAAVDAPTPGRRWPPCR